MGNGFNCKCNKCNYRFRGLLGGGFSFYRVHRNVISEILNGKYGNQCIDFINSHPNGNINTGNSVARCKECGDYQIVTDLSMYVPKAGNGNQSESIYEWIGGISRDEDYSLYERFKHKCERCGGEAEVIDDFDKKVETEHLSCPRCNGTLVMEGRILWD